MDSEALRKYGKEMIDFVANYWENMRERIVEPDVKPGYMQELVNLRVKVR